MMKYVSTVLELEYEHPGSPFIMYGYGEITIENYKNLCNFEHGLFYNGEVWEDARGKEMFVFNVHESMEECQEYIIQRLFIISK